jgi:NADH-quinone oxidoreductase subunit J
MTLTLFILAALVAIIATVLMICGSNAVHSLLYLILSLLAVGVVFFLLGAHFAAVLEVIIYAGAIMVMFVFVIMMLNQGNKTVAQERIWLSPRQWLLPSLLALVLLAEMTVAVGAAGSASTGELVTAKEVGKALYGAYLLIIELASMLLLAGLISAYHFGKPLTQKEPPEQAS